MRRKKPLALLMSCSLVLTTCIGPALTASAAKIKLNKTKLTLEVKKSFTLKLKNCKKKVKWSSSKKKVASVTAKGKCKAIVKAKKVGKTTITAKVGKKKYTCKVTVTKADNTNTKQPTGNSKTPATNAPKPTGGNTPGSNASPSPAPDPSATPDLSKEGLTKNISLEKQFYPEHILLTVTNNNPVWLDSVGVTYEYYGTDSTSIADGYEELFYLKPGESRYLAIETSTYVSEDMLDMNASEVKFDANGPVAPDGYYDRTGQVDILAEEADYESGSLALSLKNHCHLPVKGNYLIQFYKDSTLLDAVSGSIDLSEKEQVPEYINIPAQSTNYKILKSAASFEEIDDDARLAKGVTAVIDQKLANCLVVKVTNGNEKQWLKSVDIEYEFYDAEDAFLFSGSNTLSSMGPSETQYLVIDAEGEEANIQKINPNYSVARISLEVPESDVKYQNTSKVTASIESNSDPDEKVDINDESYTVTFTNKAALPADGSYIIYFRNNKGQIVSAVQGTLYLFADDSDFITLDMPQLVDQNDNTISLSALKKSDIHIVAHTYAD